MSDSKTKIVVHPETSKVYAEHDFPELVVGCGVRDGISLVTYDVAKIEERDTGRRDLYGDRVTERVVTLVPRDGGEPLTLRRHEWQERPYSVGRPGESIPEHVFAD